LYLCFHLAQGGAFVMVSRILRTGFAAAVLCRAAIPVTVVGTTPTQAVLSYTAPGDSACTVAVSQSSSLAPLVNDVNPSLFAGAGSDQRSGNLVTGTSRVVVIGQRTAALALDGNLYSRALQAFTQYYFQVTCGATTGAAQFTTANPPRGNSAPDSVPFVSGAWGNQGWPTMSWSAANQYVDPLTGLVIERISNGGHANGQEYSALYTSVVDLASAWTTPNNILGTTGYASTSATGQSNALFLPGPVENGDGFASRVVIDDLQAHFSSAYASAAGGQLSTCVTRNHGQACIGNTITIALPDGSASAATVTGPGSFPSPFFAGWGQPRLTPEDYANPTGTVNTSGTSVTLATINQTGGFPLSTVAGDKLIIAGTTYTISALVNSNQLTLTAGAGTQTGASFSMPNFGLLVWNSGSGTVFLQGGTYVEAYSNVYSIGDDGTYNPCSVGTVTVNYAANGTTPLATPETGRMCMLDDVYGNPTLYLLVLSTGEVRLIDYAEQGQGNGAVATFDPSNPNIVYYYSPNNSSNPAINKCTYSGNYAALPPNYTGVSSPNFSCTSITNGTGNDLVSQIGRVVSGFNSSYFSRVIVGSLYGNYLGLTIVAGSQGSFGYSCFFDVTQAPGSQVTGCHDTWSTYPERWGGAHGTFTVRSTSGWGNIFLVPLESSGSTGNELWQLDVTAITAESGTSLTGNLASDPTTQNCQTLGVSTSSPWYALGAAGNNCIQMTVATEPQAVSPSSVDRAQWPSACNGTYAQLQAIQPGDYLYDVANGSGYGENFLVAGKTGSGCSPITLVIARGVNQNCAYIPQPHSNGWVPGLLPTQNCNGNNYWIQASNASTAYADNSGTTLSHSFQGPGNSPDSATVAYTSTAPGADYLGYGVRQGSLPGLIGQGFQYYLPAVYPFNGNSSNVNGVAGFIQTHPGGQSNQATPSTLGYDGRPFGGAGGGVHTLWYHTYTLVSGQSNTYLITCPSSSSGGSCLDNPDPKGSGWTAWAGRFMLTDISGPSSVISDATPYTFCYAYNAGECVSASSQGNRYVSVPNSTVSGGVCTVSGLNQNTPCLAVAPASAAVATQFNWAAGDPDSINWRRLGYALGGPGQTNNYWNVHGIVDGSWAFTEVDWKDGAREDIVAIQLPPWPAADTVNRSQFVNVPIQLSGNTGDTVRIEFGYQELGAPANLYCTSRREPCFTSAGATPSDPFVWAGETQSYTACGSGCTIKVPALAGRMLYYRVHRKNAAAAEIVGPVQVKPVL
jgi:hypothetical protein